MNNIKRMKIAFIGGRNIHKLGGIETYMLNLCSRLVKLGYEPVYYCESDHDGEEIVEGFRVVHQKSIKSKFFCKPLCGLKATWHIIRKEKDTDILHYNTWGPGTFGFLARLCGKKTIFQGHGIDWRRTKWNKFQRALMFIMDWFVVRCSTKYTTAVSQEQCDMIAKLYHKKGAVRIPCAVPINDKTKIHSNIIERYGLDSENFFLSLGRLVQDKNPDYIIKAFIESGIKEKKLVIAGSNDADPFYVESLHKLAEGHDNIVFTGSVYADDKEKLLSDCMAFCIPSTLEGLPITLLEAMSYGKICIASDIQANKEALGDFGIWCKAEDVDTLKDAMIKVNTRFSELKQSQAGVKDRIKEDFTWENTVKLYMGFIDSINKK